MNNKITKGVITAGGYGTRFLPATKTLQKEMLPIIDTPIIHYIAEEFVKSKICEIIIVISPGKESVKNYFKPNKKLAQFLKKNNKYDRIEKVNKLMEQANFTFVEQPKDLPYGNASPLLAAKELIGENNFALAWGDDLFLSEKPGIGQVKDTFENSDTSGVLAVKEVSNEDITKVGAIFLKEGTKNQIKKIIEKPSLDEINSNLAEFGRFALSPDIFDYLNSDHLGKNNELWLMDAVNKMCKDKKVLACKVVGEWYTTGDPFRFLKATFEYALQREELGKKLEGYLKKRLG